GVELEVEELSTPTMAAPLDAHVSALWEGHGAHAEARLESGGRRLFDARAELEASLTGLIAGDDDWRANLHAEMCSAPLALVAPIAAAGVDGNVTGRLHLERLGTAEVVLDARLESDMLSIGKVRF